MTEDSKTMTIEVPMPEMFGAFWAELPEDLRARVVEELAQKIASRLDRSITPGILPPREMAVPTLMFGIDISEIL